MDKKQVGIVLIVVGVPLVTWALVKAMIIGYYPDELVPQIVVPAAIGLPVMWIGNWLRKSVYGTKG